DLGLCQRGDADDQVLLRLALPGADVRGPAGEEPVAAGSENDDLRGGLLFVPSSRRAHNGLDRRAVLKLPAEDDQGMAPAIAPGGRRDRSGGWVARGHRDDRGGSEAADRHPESGAPEVETGDDRNRDRGDDRWQLPSGQPGFAHRILLPSIVGFREGSTRLPPASTPSRPRSAQGANRMAG